MMTAIEVDLGAFLRLGEEIGHKLDKYDEYLSRIDAAQRSYNRGLIMPVTQTTTLNASGFGLIDLGGPPAGFEWIIRQIQFSDAALWANSMGSAVCQFGVGQIPPSAGVAMPAPSVRWAFASGPNFEAFGTNHFTAMSQSEHVYCQVSGGNAAEVVQATIVIEQWPATTPPGWLR
jgi:hypothetical protein